MSSVSNAGGQPSKRPIALVLAIIGVLGILLGIVYLAVPAGNLPHPAPTRRTATTRYA